MAIRLVSRKAKELEKSDAIEAQKALDVPGERERKAARLNRIIDWLEFERFVRADFAYCTCSQTGERYRVNGNHTSSVLVECMKNQEMPDFPHGVPLVIEEWQCDTLEELASIFDTYDNPGSVRSSADKLGIYIARYYDLDSVPKPAIAAALKGINTLRGYHNDPDYPRAQPREIGRLLRDDDARRYCRFVADLAAGAIYDGWKRPGINAAIYETWLDDEQVAQIVWEEVFAESNPVATSDSRLFVSKMRTHEARKGKPSDYFYRQFLTHWKRAKTTA